MTTINDNSKSLNDYLLCGRASGGASGKEPAPPPVQETAVQSLHWEDPLEKEMATHSNIPGKFQGQRSLVGYSP